MSQTAPTLKRHFLTALVAAPVLAVGLPVGALAGQPERFHDHFEFEDHDVDVCGMNLDVSGRGVVSGQAFFDKDGNFVRFALTSSGTSVFTADDGNYVLMHFAGKNSEQLVQIDEDAGTITIDFTHTGLPGLVKTSDGRVVLRDAGLITFRETFNLETGELLTSDIHVNKGPHPQADSGSELFCEILRDELS